MTLGSMVAWLTCFTVAAAAAKRAAVATGAFGEPPVLLVAGARQSGSALRRLCTLSCGFSLRFQGHGLNAKGLDRVEIPIDPPVPADIGITDFTIELWIKADPGDNLPGACQEGGFSWINNSIFLDRDIFGAGDFGDYGASMGNGRIAFGVGNGSSDHTICSTSDLADGAWHHLAMSHRFSDGQMSIFVDGSLERQAQGPAGDISYRDGRISPWPEDPYLVLGTEKHDVQHTPFKGWIDELRLSTVLRYSADFGLPTQPFLADPASAALYHFDEGSGDIIHDRSGASGGPSDGVRLFGGTPPGPVWTSDNPFASPSPARSVSAGWKNGGRP